MTTNMWTVIKHNSNAIVTITTRCKVTALDFYEKEARTLMQDESLEVWDNGKLVSRCQYVESPPCGFVPVIPDRSKSA